MGFLLWFCLLLEHRLLVHGLQWLQHTQAQLLLDMWSLPGLGVEPVSLALAGRFLPTVPPEESNLFYFWCIQSKLQTTVHFNS